MPIYEFRCKSCDTEFETLVWQSGADDPIKCLKCESTDVERILSVCAGSTSQNRSSCQPQTTGFS